MRELDILHQGASSLQQHFPYLQKYTHSFLTLSQHPAYHSCFLLVRVFPPAVDPSHRPPPPFVSRPVLPQLPHFLLTCLSTMNAVRVIPLPAVPIYSLKVSIACTTREWQLISKFESFWEDGAVSYLRKRVYMAVKGAGTGRLVNGSLIIKYISHPLQKLLMNLNFLPHPPNSAWLPPMDPNDEETLENEEAMIEEDFKHVLTQDLTGALGTFQVREDEQEEEEEEQGDDMDDYADEIQIPEGEEEL